MRSSYSFEYLKIATFLLIITDISVKSFENKTLKCFLRSSNNTSGYLYATDEKDSSTFDRIITAHSLDYVNDTNFIKWELINTGERYNYLLRNIKYNEFLCAKYYTDSKKLNHKVIGWKLKFAKDQMINIYGHMVKVLDMMKSEKKCIWRIKKLKNKRYSIINFQYNERLVAVPHDEPKSVFTTKNFTRNSTRTSWLIDCITIDFD